jgi:predicted RNA binding protein YcfA (HicA-like mRNA interferase family)
MSIIPQFNQNNFIKLCQKLNLEIITKSGKGSHVKIKQPDTGKFLIVPQKIKKGLAVRLIKDLESWGFNKEEIIQLLK